MQIPVLIERLSRDSYRARSGGALVLTAEGTTRDEALNKLRDLFKQTLRNGAELTEFTIQAIPPRSWPPPRIHDPDDPVVQEWIQIMEENRRKVEEEPDIP
jgi:hypothetical protein